jgi:hypothetical protein
MARTLRTAWQSVAWQGLAPLRYPTPHLPSSQRLLNIWDVRAFVDPPAGVGGWGGPLDRRKDAYRGVADCEAPG